MRPRMPAFCPLLLAGVVLVAGCRVPPTQALAEGASAPPTHGSALLVLNKSGASAWLLDARDGRRLAQLPTGDGPHEVAVAPDGRRALISNYGQEEPGRSLTLVDIADARVLRQIDLGPYRRPHGVVWLPDGKRALVTVEANQALLIVDVDAAGVEASIPTGEEGAHMVVAAPDGRHAWVSSIAAGSVSLIDLPGRRVLRRVVTGEGAEGLDVSPDGHELWVGNRAENTISVLDAQSLALRDRIHSGDFPIRVKFAPDGRHVLVTHARSGELRRFDARTREARGSLRFTVDEKRARPTMLGKRFGGAVPIGLAVAADARTAFVALAGTDEIAVVQLEPLRVKGYWPTGPEPDGLGLATMP